MVRFSRLSVFAGLCVLVGVQIAKAADIPMGDMGGYKDTPAEDGTYVPAPIPMEETARWYLRGDFSYSLFTDPESLVTNGASSESITDDDVKDAYGLGGGFGYYISPSLRVDLTFDYHFTTDVQASYSGSIGGDFSGLELTSFAALANVYYEFAPHWRFSPYVGAGIGLAHHELRQPTNATVINIENRDATALAGALMAGVSVSLGNGWLLDVGYRYLYLGDAKMTYAVAAGDPTLKIKDLAAHQLRLGLRMDLY